MQEDEMRKYLPGDLGVARMHDLYKSRRRKKIVLPENALINCVMMSASVPGDCVVKLSLDLPPGTVVLTRIYDACLQAECLIVANESWPEHDGSGILEEIRPKAEYVLVNVAQARHHENISHPFVGKEGVTPLNLPFVIPMDKLDKVTRVVANAVLSDPTILTEAERVKALNFFSMILGSQAVAEATQFMDPALGEPHKIEELHNPSMDALVGMAWPEQKPKVEDPFNKTWRDKDPML